MIMMMRLSMAIMTMGDDDCMMIKQWIPGEMLDPQRAETGGW